MFGSGIKAGRGTNSGERGLRVSARGPSLNQRSPKAVEIDVCGSCVVRRRQSCKLRGHSFEVAPGTRPERLVHAVQ